MKLYGFWPEAGLPQAEPLHASLLPVVEVEEGDKQPFVTVSWRLVVWILYWFTLPCLILSKSGDPR